MHDEPGHMNNMTTSELKPVVWNSWRPRKVDIITFQRLVKQTATYRNVNPPTMHLSLRFNGVVQADLQLFDLPTLEVRSQSEILHDLPQFIRDLIHLRSPRDVESTITTSSCGLNVVPNDTSGCDSAVAAYFQFLVTLSWQMKGAQSLFNSLALRQR